MCECTLLYVVSQEFKVPVDAKVGAGPLTSRIYHDLLDIQTGRVDHPWSLVLD